MKQSILFILFILSAPFIFSQVGIGTQSPNLSLSLLNPDSGLESTTDSELLLISDGNVGLSTTRNGVGVGVETPLSIFHIDTKGLGFRLSNFKESTTDIFDFMMVNSSSSEIGVRSVANSLGQFIRIGFPETNFSNNGNNGAWQDLLFKTDLGLAPNNAPNFVDEITDSFIDQTNTTTSSIQLSEGTYSLSLKLVGQFGTSAPNNRIDVRVLVNGNEYSSLNSIFSGNGGGAPLPDEDPVRKSGYFNDLITVSSGNTATIQLQVRVWDTSVVLFESFVPSNSMGNSSRSLLTAQRLQ